MNLDDLSDFLLVAQHDGIAAASRQSGRPKASLSRKVMALELALGVRLLERSARHIRLTEEGTLLLERAGGPVRELREVAETLRDRKTKPHGLLRINAPTLMGQLMLGRLAAQFVQAYPQVELSVALDDREVDLVKEGYDLVIRVNPSPRSELVGRCFARDRVLVVSTPELKSRFTQAGRSSEGPVPVICRGPSRAGPWKIAAQGAMEWPTHTVLQLPLLTMIRDAALTGLGAARLPRLVVADDLAAGRLVSWGTAADQPSELWALHTSGRLASPKVRVFMEFLEAAFKSAWP